MADAVGAAVPAGDSVDGIGVGEGSAGSREAPGPTDAGAPEQLTTSKTRAAQDASRGNPRRGPTFSSDPP
jgi:hypothetical protein